MATDFGTDLSALHDLDPMGRLVTGLDLVVQRLWHRLTTPRGGLFYAPNYGFDVGAALNAKMGTSARFAMQSAVARECEKDEAVLSATCSVSLDLKTEILTVRIGITTADGPFRFVVGITSVGAELLTVDT